MERLPYAQRMRNRCIAIAVLVFIIVAIVHCSTKEELSSENIVEKDSSTAPESVAETTVANDTNAFDDTTFLDTAQPNPNGLSRLTGIEDEDFDKARNGSGLDENGRDTLHIKSQKDPYLAEKIDQLLRRYRPDLCVILVVNTRTNEIIAWGERRDGKVQNRPDYIGRSTFPAASLAKLVTISAAMESNRYSLNTPIPMIGWNLPRHSPDPQTRPWPSSEKTSAQNDYSPRQRSSATTGGSRETHRTPPAIPHRTLATGWPKFLADSRHRQRSRRSLPPLKSVRSSRKSRSKFRGPVTWLPSPHKSQSHWTSASSPKIRITGCANRCCDPSRKGLPTSTCPQRTWRARTSKLSASAARPARWTETTRLGVTTGSWDSPKRETIPANPSL